jgi:membrane protein implicated in regulation of membrane protease activity
VNWLWIWLTVALLAAIGELTSSGLFLACVFLAAIVTAVSTFLIGPTLQVVLFAAASLVGIGVFRPFMLRAVGWHGAPEITGTSSHSHIMNRRATVTRTVDAGGGQIRVGEGEFWSARSFDPADVMPIGSTVEVVVVDGLTALVAPIEQPALPAEAASEKGTS